MSKKIKNKQQTPAHNTQPNKSCTARTVFLKKDENGIGQTGILLGIRNGTIAEIYFSNTRQTRYYNIYSAFLQENPIFKVRGKKAQELISGTKGHVKCSGCGAQKVHLTASGKLLLCDKCITKYRVCEKCHAYTKARYDFYDLHAHKFFLICENCLNLNRKNKSYDFETINSIKIWSEYHDEIWGQVLTYYSPEFRTESILRQYGYNVNSQENISSYERKCLLYSIIRNGFIRKDKVIAFLHHHISLNGKSKNMESAVKKWQEDISYVKTLKPPYKRPV